MKIRSTKIVSSLLAIGIIGIAGLTKVNAVLDDPDPDTNSTSQTYTFSVGNRSPFGLLNLSGLYIKPTTSTTGIILNGYVIKVDPYHKTNITGQIRVEEICDESGGNCNQVSTLGNGYWKLNNSTLSTSGNYNVNINSGLTVTGDTKLNGNIIIQGNGGWNSFNMWANDILIASQGISITGETTLNNNVTIRGTGFFNNKLNVTAGGLEVSGTTIMNNQLNIKTGGLEVTGTTTLNNGLTVKGTTTTEGNLIAGSTTTGITIDHANAMMISNYYGITINNASFSVNGSTALNGSVTITGGDLTVNDLTTKNSALFKNGLKIQFQNQIPGCGISNNGLIKYTSDTQNYPEVMLIFCACNHNNECRRIKIAESE